MNKGHPGGIDEQIPDAVATEDLPLKITQEILQQDYVDHMKEWQNDINYTTNNCIAVVGEYATHQFMKFDEKKLKLIKVESAEKHAKGDVASENFLLNITQEVTQQDYVDHTKERQNDTHYTTNSQRNKTTIKAKSADEYMASRTKMDLWTQMINRRSGA